MKNAVMYRGMLLAKNSEAYALWVLKEFKKLDAHLKEVEQRSKDLMNRYK